MSTPSAFFSVCLTAADDSEESRTATREYLDEFVERTGWTPHRSTTFAGALQYREYDFPTRLLMRLLMHECITRPTCRRTTTTPTGMRSTGGRTSSRASSADNY